MMYDHDPKLTTIKRWKAAHDRACQFTCCPLCMIDPVGIFYQVTDSLDLLIHGDFLSR